MLWTNRPFTNIPPEFLGCCATRTKTNFLLEISIRIGDDANRSSNRRTRDPKNSIAVDCFADLSFEHPEIIFQIPKDKEKSA